MDKTQRNYLRQRLDEAFKRKKAKIEDETATKNAAITGREVHAGIVDGTFRLMRTGPLESGYGSPDLSIVFNIPQERFRNTSVDEKARKARINKLKKAFDKALDEIMLNKIDADLVALLRGFEEFEA